MKVLVIGSGGREHALAHTLSHSPSVELVDVSPGNGGTWWDAGGRAACRSLAEADPKQYDLVVIGPEAPLADGLADRLLEAGVPVFGPTRAAARIETSKRFAKELMRSLDVPTADFVVCETYQQARAELERFGAPVVIKADGLAAGKGVGVFEQMGPAQEFLHSLMDSEKFGQAGQTVLLEERLEGPELSVLAFCDGKKAVQMPAARDHKRLEEGDRGPNTGGMGAFSPVPGVDVELLAQVQEEIFDPVMAALAARGCPFVGVLYAGLILTASGPKVLEFNCRFGDPETQVVLPLFEGDLARLMLACTRGKLDPTLLRWSKDTCAAVVMASAGYPESAQKGVPIQLPEEGLIFHAGTARGPEGLVTAGGRVLAAVGRGQDLGQALEAAYALVEQVHFEGAVYRKDIGKVAVS
ncbi:MAG: phosphoribosylamine--glycine ligase [Vulcanimicrobiota bacterium]